MGNIKPIVAGLLTGSAIGTVIVLTTTKRSGKEMRKQIMHQINMIKNSYQQCKEKSCSMKQHMKDSSHTISTELKQYSEHMRSSIQKWKEETKPNMDQINQRVKEISTLLTDLELKYK